MIPSPVSVIGPCLFVRGVIVNDDIRGEQVHIPSADHTVELLVARVRKVRNVVRVRVHVASGVGAQEMLA